MALGAPARVRRCRHNGTDGVVASGRSEKRSDGRSTGQQDGQQDGQDEDPYRLAIRLRPQVDWVRMSAAAVRRALGLPPPAARERREFEAGQADRAAGRPLSPDAPLAYRAGHRRPPRRRRRRRLCRLAAGREVR